MPKAAPKKPGRSATPRRSGSVRGVQAMVRADQYAPPEIPRRRCLKTRTVDSGLGLIELPTRPLNEYTVEQWLCALERLEGGGSFREAADLTRAAITQWGFASGILDTITGGILGLPRNVIVGQGEERLKEALEGKQGVGGDLDRLEPRAEAKQIMAWGITLGIGVGQIIQPDHEPHEPPERTEALPLTQTMDGSWGYRPRPMALPMADRGNVCPSLLAWDPRWIRYQWWDRRIFINTSRGEVEICPGDGEWFVFMPHGQSYPWRYGAWLYLVLAFVMARDAVFDRGRHMQLSPPVRVGVVPLGTTERQRKTYANQIDQMKNFSWFVLPPGLDYKVVESGTTGQVDAIYSSAISWSERQVAIGLTGNEVMVEGNKGFATADVFERVTATKRAGYARIWEEHERTQLLPWYVWENYGPGVGVPAVVRQTDPPEDQDKRVERVGKFGESLTKLRNGLSDVGGELDWESVVEMAQTMGLKVSQKKETGAAPTSHIEVTPTATEAIITAEELRGQEGLGPFGDERDDQTIAQLLGDAPAQGASQTPEGSSVPAVP